MTIQPDFILTEVNQKYMEMWYYKKPNPIE